MQISKIITFFTCCGLDDPGGFGRSFPLAKELVRNGFNVNYLALHANYKSLKIRRFIKEGVNIFYVGQLHVLKEGDKKYYFNKFQLLKVVVHSTFKMLLQGLFLKTDIIYCFRPQPINGFAALITKFFKFKPLILDCEDYETASNRLTRFQKNIFSFFEDNFPKFSIKVTYHNMFLKNRYLDLGFLENKFVYLPNGIDEQRFVLKDKSEVLKRRYNLNNKKVVLYCGSLSLNSGHAIDLLIKAFTSIQNKISNARLLIVGSGEDIDYLKNLVPASISDKVIFTGRVSPFETPYFYQLADVSVDPVRDTLANKARSPLKILESIALGVPIVTSDIGDRKLLIKNNITGALVKPGDAESLAGGIVGFLNNNNETEFLKKECSHIIKKHYWHVIAKKLLEDIPLLKN